MTREEWLRSAILELEPLFAECDVILPATTRVSVGWPGGRGKKGNVIGQCWAPAASADGSTEIFISPALGDAVQVLGVLAHELVHAVNFRDSPDMRQKHGAGFGKIARAIGLEGKLTATTPGAALCARLTAFSEALGTYPHAAMSVASKPIVQRTYMLKLEAIFCCDYTVRTTRKWVDAEGYPRCPHGSTMQLV